MNDTLGGGGIVRIQRAIQKKAKTNADVIKFRAFKISQKSSDRFMLWKKKKMNFEYTQCQLLVAFRYCRYFHIISICLFVCSRNKSMDRALKGQLLFVNTNMNKTASRNVLG